MINLRNYGHCPEGHMDPKGIFVRPFYSPLPPQKIPKNVQLLLNNYFDSFKT